MRSLSFFRARPLSLILTWLQPGEQVHNDFENRFNGFLFSRNYTSLDFSFTPGFSPVIRASPVTTGNRFNGFLRLAIPSHIA
jgi:hypothetical protein